jgi:hypothetical protein
MGRGTWILTWESVPVASARQNGPHSVIWPYLRHKKKRSTSQKTRKKHAVLGRIDVSIRVGHVARTVVRERVDQHRPDLFEMVPDGGMASCGVCAEPGGLARGR